MIILVKIISLILILLGSYLIIDTLALMDREK